MTASNRAPSGQRVHVLVIGGGAAGMQAAYQASCAGARVTLVERNEKVGRKLYITGKGRCNLTNNCSADEALQNVPRNGKFLYSALRAFPPEQTMALFTDLGVPLKTERGNRVFPVSDRAADVIDALYYALRRHRVELVHGRVTALLTQAGRISGVKLEDGGTLRADRVVLATGGCSYPATGSTGDGYRLCAEVGHTVVSPKPSLIPLVEEGEDCAKMQGLSLRNIEIKVRNWKNKVIYQAFGELLFTHFGLSGPVILSASAHMREFEREHYTVSVDLKPALDEKKLDERILRDFGDNPNREIGNVLGALLPRLMIPVVLSRTGIPADTRVHDVSRAQRRALLETVKRFDVSIRGPRPVEEAIITSGGVKVGEVNPSTMASKRCSGLYLAGEVLDVDAYTGGFNLQIAWATGYVAGLHAATDAAEGKDEA